MIWAFYTAGVFWPSDQTEIKRPFNGIGRYEAFFAFRIGKGPLSGRELIPSETHSLSPHEGSPEAPFADRVPDCGLPNSLNSTTVQLIRGKDRLVMNDVAFQSRNRDHQTNLNRQKELTMQSERNGRFVIALALLASVVCHFAIQRHFARICRQTGDLAQYTVKSMNDPMFVAPLELSNSGLPKVPRMLADNRLPGRIVPALDVQDEDRIASRPGTNRPSTAVESVPSPAEAPAEVPASDDPIAHVVDATGVREVIEQELSHASREERDIWYDELKSLPAGVVRDLLQVRKQIHALPRLLGGMPEKLASADPALPARSHEVSAEPASQKIRFNIPEHSAATSVETAISQLRHNVANAMTPGFKRLRVTIVDSYTNSWQDNDSVPSAESPRTMLRGDGCQIAPIVLDLKQGKLKKTERPLDLAIDGDGFFVVRRGEKDFLTRCGVFTLGRDRQVCLAVCDDVVPLQPAIKIPADAREIQISANGSVAVLLENQTTPTAVGQIQLGRVPAADRLQPIGDTLYAPNQNSGDVELAAPLASGLGELQQGYLEQSNADLERELDEIDHLTTILKAFPSPMSRPATARTHQPSPTR